MGLIKKSSCETMATGSTGFGVWRCCRALHGCSGHQRHGLQRHRLRRRVFCPVLQRPAGTGADTFAVSVLSRIFDNYNNIIPCRCWIFSMFRHKNGPRLRVNSSLSTWFTLKHKCDCDTIKYCLMHANFVSNFRCSRVG